MHNKVQLQKYNLLIAWWRFYFFILTHSKAHAKITKSIKKVNGKLYKIATLTISSMLSTSVNAMQCILLLPFPYAERCGQGEKKVWLKANMESFDVGPWKISVIKSHILKSKCEEGSSTSGEPCGKCNVCRYWIIDTLLRLFL